MSTFLKLRNHAISGLLACIILSLAGHSVSAGKVEDGLAAYNRGDFATALRLWRDAAEEGSAAAQNNLGIMYDLGKGVPRSDKLAHFWFLKSAKQGYANAQFNLGRKYDNGEGVTANEVTAYMFFVLAASGGNRAFKIQRDKLAKHLSAEQRRTAHQLAQEWLNAQNSQ